MTPPKKKQLIKPSNNKQTRLNKPSVGCVAPHPQFYNTQLIEAKSYFARHGFLDRFAVLGKQLQPLGGGVEKCRLHHHICLWDFETSPSDIRSIYHPCRERQVKKKPWYNNQTRRCQSMSKRQTFNIIGSKCVLNLFRIQANLNGLVYSRLIWKKKEENTLGKTQS